MVSMLLAACLAVGCGEDDDLCLGPRLEQELFPSRVPELLADEFKQLQSPLNASALLRLRKLAKSEDDKYQVDISVGRLLLKAGHVQAAEEVFQRLSTATPPSLTQQLDREYLAYKLGHDSFTVESAKHVSNINMDVRALVLIVLAVDHLRRVNPDEARKSSDLSESSKELLRSIAPELAKKLRLK